MEVRTTRFGVVEIAEDRVITFPKGLLGFGQMKRYCLLEPGNDACFFWLQSLDDPTLGLDTVVRRDFLESLIQIIQREGRTILISSHILADVERVADRIGILVDGVLRVDCPTDYFKMSLRKIVLEFATQPPAFPACDGLVSTWRVAPWPRGTQSVRPFTGRG